MRAALRTSSRAMFFSAGLYQRLGARLFLNAASRRQGRDEVVRRDTVESDRRGEHLSDEDCVDLGRRLAAPERRALMERHLDAGCARCARSVGLWSALSRFAAEEPGFDPPEAAVREVKSRFAANRRPRLGERIARAATLVFDSFRQPLPAGVRAAGPSIRQMLFRSGPYIVRLRLEPQAGSDRVSIVGQIEDEQHPGLSLHDVAVLARGGRTRRRWTGPSRTIWVSSCWSPKTPRTSSCRWPCPGSAPSSFVRVARRAEGNGRGRASAAEALRHGTRSR